MKKIYVTQAQLAKHLGVSVHVVINWRRRGTIKAKKDAVTGLYLVEKIDEKPTKSYKDKDVSGGPDEDVNV